MNINQAQESGRWTEPPPSAAPSDQPAKLPITMPGPPAQTAHDIAQVGVEGEPADATAGPGFLVGEVAIAAVIILLIAAGMTWWLGWAAGLAMLAIGSVAMVLNPVVAATWARVGDRQKVIKGQGHTGSDPTLVRDFPRQSPDVP